MTASVYVRTNKDELVVDVTITNVSYSGSIPAGGTLSSPSGLNGLWSGSNGPPTAFALNGMGCAVI